MLAINYWIQDLPISVVCKSNEIPLEKPNFSFTRGCQLEIASWVWMEVHVSFLLSAQGTHVFWTCVVAALSLSSYVYLLCLKGTVSVVCSTPSGSYNFSSSSSIFLRPEGLDLMKTSLLALSVSKFLTLYIFQL